MLRNKLNQMKPLIGFLLFVLLYASTNCQPNLYSVKNYGAIGDGKTDDAAAIQKTIDACVAAGGGTVLLPAPYTYLAGPFKLRSNIDFHIAGGAKLLANPNEQVYTESAFHENKGEGTLWISGEGVENLSVSGTGEINGNGIAFMGAELEDSYVLKPFNIADPRPHVLTLTGGKNIRIKDLHIGNSAYWTVHLIGCNDVVISGITLLNNLKVRNSDGIDIDHSKNVRISDCFIESGDDCICLKNRREFSSYGRCENITVTNCTMTSRSCAIKIGSENMDTIRQVVFANCIIKKSNRGLGIQNRDEGVVSDIVFSDILVEGHLFSDMWWGKAEPIYITAFRRASGNHKDANWRFPPGATEGSVGEIKNIYFSNIRCSSENGVYVAAESKDKIINIYFDRVSVLIHKTTAIPGGVYDRRPSLAEGLIHSGTSGFCFESASGISMQNCSVQWGLNKPDYYTYVINSRNVDSLTLFNLEGKAAFPERLEAKHIIQ